jgi:AbrB family looped-hinge helix DNA binding protein
VPDDPPYMATSTLTSKSQVTIPKGVWRRMGLTDGDRLEFLFADEHLHALPQDPEVDDATSQLDKPTGRCTGVEPTLRSPMNR